MDQRTGASNGSGSTDGDPADQKLLAAYVDECDDDAFVAIAGRQGGMVYRGSATGSSATRMMQRRPPETDALGDCRKPPRL